MNYRTMDASGWARVRGGADGGVDWPSMGTCELRDRTSVGVSTGNFSRIGYLPATVSDQATLPDGNVCEAFNPGKDGCAIMLMQYDGSQAAGALPRDRGCREPDRSNFPKPGK